MCMYIRVYKHIHITIYIYSSTYIKHINISSIYVRIFQYFLLSAGRFGERAEDFLFQEAEVLPPPSSALLGFRV